MTCVKICGITNDEDAAAACEAGASALGFVFYAKSKRYVDPGTAAAIIAGLPPFVFKVGVFVDADVNMVAEIARFCKLDVAQLHGGESPAYCRQLKGLKKMKAIRVAGPDDVAAAAQYRGAVDAILYDAYVEGEPGGTGCSVPLDWLAGAEQPYLLAGGLTPENVAAAVLALRPLGVDVSSGVEIEPGIKDHDKIRRFLKAAKFPEEVGSVA